MCGLACPLLAKPLGDRPFTDGPLSTPSPSVTALGSAAVWQILLHLPPSPDCGPPWGGGKVFSPEVHSTQRGASTQERCLVNSHWINRWILPGPGAAGGSRPSLRLDPRHSGPSTTLLSDSFILILVLLPRSREEWVAGAPLQGGVGCWGPSAGRNGLLGPPCSPLPHPP